MTAKEIIKNGTDISKCEYISSGEKYLKALDEVENLITDNDNYFTNDILDIIKRTGGQRVKAAAYPFNARRPRQKAKEGGK